ncbi:MAG: glutamate ligase [Flavobacteriaceae bacterium]|nr:glutamate ligase [Flavobacteriaceae bacterium]|tara:strand:- start:101845 stop:102822 length:978 start_codon:yes stop_codon:yes gene_type:complete
MIFTPIKGYEHLVASTQLLIEEVFARGGRVEILDNRMNHLLIHLNNQAFPVVGTTYIQNTSLLNYIVCNDKVLCKKELLRFGFDTSNYQVIKALEEVEHIQLNYPLVVKPLDENHGRGVVTNIVNSAQLIKVVKESLLLHSVLLIEEQIQGDEYRFLVIDHQLIGVIKRIPANLMGDGKHSFRELFDQKNEGRGTDYKFPLMKIQESLFTNYLKSNGLNDDDVPKVGEVHFLTSVSNLKLGGDSMDVTDEIPIFFKELATSITKKFNLPIAGIDIIIPNTNAEEYSVIEINERPMTSMHSYPFKGKNRNAEKYLLDVILKVNKER